ncbi:MAG: myo-inositol catabolism protein LolB [Treponema sp. GWB1_62_6]|nr:MAG: myo-inositol catabolism protein LolB [Treponema sp. GWC1_61_84]OHE70987.1 MAG: myo-inositol catabolism protein LolB [Treponema sp. GWB1_62_6]HCM25674.1 myo-inositol catabolism protein LolB [Treponema sp.]
MQIRHRAPFVRGSTLLVNRSGGTADMLMDFGPLLLAPGEEITDFAEEDERAFLLVRGGARLSWPGGTMDVTRGSLFDESPWTLLVPRKAKVVIKAGPSGAEFYRMATENASDYKARLFTPAECGSEFRGAGTMQETSTRIVRTVFNDSNMPQSKLVVGEVIGIPGKWSSYPPHHHPQPEIYHYRFLPERGFGLTAIGDRPYMLHNRDTILIREGEDHPQVTAPGYAMWYLWVIRHLDGDRYGNPTFTEAHEWVSEPDAPIWSPRIK